MTARATSPIPLTITKIVVLSLLGEMSAAPRVTGGGLFEVVASGGSAELSTSTGSSTAATLMRPSEGIALISCWGPVATAVDTRRMIMAKKDLGTTRGGEPITDELVETLVDQAEAGFDTEEILLRRGGRPPMGSAAASVESVRLDPKLRQALSERADAEGRTNPELIETHFGDTSTQAELDSPCDSRFRPNPTRSSTAHESDRNWRCRGVPHLVRRNVKLAPLPAEGRTRGRCAAAVPGLRL